VTVGDKSAIEWTDATWNPIRGCSRVSEGCRNCYAERVAARFARPGQAYAGLARWTPWKDGERDARWTGEVRLVEAALDLPLRWKRPRRIFVNSMSDLFHEKVPDEWIDRIFAVMALSREHTFQVLTKRPERMRAYLEQVSDERDMQRWARWADIAKSPCAAGVFDELDWPLPNVWLGVSVEDQPTADERIPLLLLAPAAVRWVSYEPALGPVDFTRVPWGWKYPLGSERERVYADALTDRLWLYDEGDVEQPRLDWLVVGGESGPGARPFDLAWARSAIAQCRAAGVPVFVKQLGSRPWWDGFGQPPADHVYLERDAILNGQVGWRLDCLRDRKGGSPEEWPEDLRVREYPA
jgi:protein gp37